MATIAGRAVYAYVSTSYTVMSCKTTDVNGTEPNMLASSTHNVYYHIALRALI